ncbi:ribonuclease H-like domain-containing protein [Tanacetum coccineum]
MSVHGYTDDEYENFVHYGNDNVTLISKLDVSHPLNLQLNDSVALTVIFVKLKGTENYQVWSCAMLLPLEGKNKTGFIDGTCKRSNVDEVCTCHAADDFKEHHQLIKLMQFLMGLDDSYIQIRSSILSKETLPDVRSAYATNSSEKSHRVASGSSSGPFKRSQTSAFSDNDNSINEKGVHVNMAGANQHMTYTDKFLVNVIDVSYLEIMVSYPNETKTFITKIRNMPLTESLTLYDVLVILRYCVSLMSVHKVARDSKLIVALVEMNCYALDQDLRAGKVLGTAKQIGGLLGHPIDQIPPVLVGSWDEYLFLTALYLDNDKYMVGLWVFPL